MTQVFVSYSHDDIVAVQRLHSDLVAAGFDIWIDEKLKAGISSWLKEIERQIEQSNAVIVVLSPSAKKSEWVARELLYATTHEVPIIPILHKGDEKLSIPLLLIATQYIDMRFRNKRASRIIDLIEILKTNGEKEDATEQQHKDYELSYYVTSGLSQIELLTKRMEYLDSLTRELNRKLWAHVPEFQSAEAQNNITGKERVLKVVSEYLMDYSEKIEEEMPSFKDIWIGLMQNIKAVFSISSLTTPEQEQEYIHFRSSVEDARSAFEGTAQSLQNFIQRLADLERESKAIKRAVRLASPSMEDLEISLETGVIYLDSLWHMANEEINRYKNV